MKSMTCLHGVFINIFNTGVLITGESGIGKSELALALIIRGHPFIADDICEFRVTANNKILGHCPELLRGFLAIHGIGVLNISKLYGNNSVQSEQYLSLIIHLTKEVTAQAPMIDKHKRSAMRQGWTKKFQKKRSKLTYVSNFLKLFRSRLTIDERLPPEAELLHSAAIEDPVEYIDFLDNKIPQITLSVSHRHLDSLIETLVQHHLLKQKGYDANRDFVQQQQDLLL